MLLLQTGTTALSVVALQDHWINLEVGAAVNRCGLLSEDQREHSFLWNRKMTNITWPLDDLMPRHVGCACVITCMPHSLTVCSGCKARTSRPEALHTLHLQRWVFLQQGRQPRSGGWIAQGTGLKRDKAKSLYVYVKVLCKFLHWLFGVVPRVASAVGGGAERAARSCTERSVHHQLFGEE